MVNKLRYSSKQNGEVLTKSNFKNSDDDELIEPFNKVFKQWIIICIVVMSLFFIYHLVLVPNIELIKLLVSGKKTTYFVHVLIKSLLMLFVFLSFINIDVLVITKLLRNKYDKETKSDKAFSNKYKSFIKVFCIYLYFFYVTLILIIPAKYLKEYLTNAVE